MLKMFRSDPGSENIGRGIVLQCKTAERLAWEGEEFNLPIVLRLELNVLEPNVPQRHHPQGKDVERSKISCGVRVFGLKQKT